MPSQCMCLGSQSSYACCGICVTNLTVQIEALVLCIKTTDKLLWTICTTLQMGVISIVFLFWCIWSMCYYDGWWLAVAVPEAFCCQGRFAVVNIFSLQKLGGIDTPGAVISDMVLVGPNVSAYEPDSFWQCLVI